MPCGCWLPAGLRPWEPGHSSALLSQHHLQQHVAWLHAWFRGVLVLLMRLIVRLALRTAAASAPELIPWGWALLAGRGCSWRARHRLL